MTDIEYIVGVYNYVNAFPELNSDSAYYLLYLLDEKGLLDKSIAHKLYDEHFKSELSSANIHQNMIGPFDSTDHLNQFAFQLCEEMNAQKVSILSVQEYNTLLENSHSASDFHRDLLLKGNVMENIERKKKGFLSRFF
ncbi:MAG: hypothetical protein ACXVLQ_03800 [Bacteriovorax sp.]